MKHIPLTQNKVAIVDDRYLDYLMQFSWSAHKDYSDRGNSRYYAVTRITNNGKTIHRAMHQIIATLEGIVGDSIDHRDGDGLNNAVENLRSANIFQQNRNQKCRSSTGYKGVSIINKAKFKPFKVKINNPITGKEEYLGTYFTAKEGAYIYDHFARLYFGEFARLNFPKEGEQQA